MAYARWQSTIVDGKGDVIPSPWIEVRGEAPGAPLATIYSDRDGSTPLGNPFQVQTADGFAAFHVAGGAYKIRAYASGFEQVLRYVGIGTNSEGDATVATPEITTSSATPTPAIASSKHHYNLTALAEAAAFGAPTGAPAGGYSLIIRVKDNGSARALSWNSIYRAGTDIALPTTTVISKTMYVGFIYNEADTKWDLVAVVNNI